MKAPHLKKSVLALTAIALLAGCATPPPNTPVGELKVVKRASVGSIKSLMAPRTVSCADQSAQAWPQSRWAEHNYLPVKQEMDALLAACETKVVAALDGLLRD